MTGGEEWPEWGKFRKEQEKRRWEVVVSSQFQQAWMHRTFNPRVVKLTQLVYGLYLSCILLKKTFLHFLPEVMSALPYYFKHRHICKRERFSFKIKYNVFPLLQFSNFLSQRTSYFSSKRASLSNIPFSGVISWG
jgi:hypothetical protein